MEFKHKLNGKVNKMNSKYIIREMAKPIGLKHAVSIKNHLRECVGSCLQGYQTSKHRLNMFYNERGTIKKNLKK